MKKGKKKVNTNFLLLLLGRMVSDTGTSALMGIIPLYIIDIGGSAATVGLFSFVSLMPALLMYPFAGVLGDRLNRKTIMVATNLASGLVLLGLALAAYSSHMNLALLLSIQVIVSLLNGLFDPATKGMLPQLVTQDELTRANSAVASLRTLSALLGPVIGAALYASTGITILFFINGFTFLLAGFSELMIRYEHLQETDEKVPGILTDLSVGIQFIFKNKVILKLCVYFLVIYAFIQPVFSVVLPLFFRIRLEYSDTYYGYLQMIFILGALLGSILAGVMFGKEEKVARPLIIGCIQLMGTLLAFSILLFPYSLSVLGNDTILYFALLAGVLCLLSVAIMFVNIPVQTFIQKNTPNEYMSRVFSIVGMITKGGIPFGAFVYGLILNNVEMQITVLAAVLLVILISVMFMASILKSPDI